MRRALKNWIAALVFVASMGGTVLTVALPQTTAAASPECNGFLLTFPSWYNGLAELHPDGSCGIIQPDQATGGISGFVWKIALNILEFMLQLVGYVSVGFIIVGGFKYMTSAGSPDGMTKSKKTIMNAVIGLVISIASVAIINIIAGALHN